MKKSIITSILAVLTALMTAGIAQNLPKEYLGLPGDNLNLYAVMKLFQESETLESFERSLNDNNSMINNLDLNGDNLVDYITVSDYVEGNVHTIVLRVALNRNEYQDVAVFIVRKFKDGSVQIQLIGDEALYGKNYIIEPVYKETPNPGYIGTPQKKVVVTTYYNIAAWPVIRHIYLPGYVVWRSSWYWGYYPVYWTPWRPYYWHYYYGYHVNWYPHYYNYYRYYDHYRWARYNDYYYKSIRVYSPTVVVNINNGYYQTTYSRPEKKLEGEALYAKRVSMENSETQKRAAIKTQDRTAPANQAVRVRTNTGNNTTTARSINDNTRKNATGSVNVSRKTETVRNTPDNTNNRTITNRTGVQNNRPATTINTPVNEKTTVRTTTVKKAAGTQNSPSRVTERTAHAQVNTITKKAAATQSSPARVAERSAPAKPEVQRTAPQRTTAVKPASATNTTVRPKANVNNNNTAIRNSTGASTNSRTNPR